MRAYLHLADGEILTGTHFGYAGESEGEVVFTTGMTGYPESLTDPSFAGQILTFTYPLLGNYGIPTPRKIAPRLLQNFESEKVWVKGVVVASETRNYSHFDAILTLDQWLKKNKVPGISQIDTRALTLKLREHGVLRGKITFSKRRVTFPRQTEPDWVQITSHTQIETYLPPGKKFRQTIALIDCGVKHGILRALLDENYRVIRVSFDFNPLNLNQKIDGVVCSNGPGDPKVCRKTIANIRDVLKAGIPYLGICLGHQLLALAVGADTYKLPYGHRGLNQPCQDVFSKKAYITSQNHGYAVNPKTLPTDFNEWFVNLNDWTNEGIIHKNGKIKSTQFHPEGSPGPFDAKGIFGHFKEFSI